MPSNPAGPSSVSGRTRLSFYNAFREAASVPDFSLSLKSVKVPVKMIAIVKMAPLMNAPTTGLSAPCQDRSDRLPS